MKTEQQIISEIRQNLRELEIEAYGERKHGNREFPPNIYHFYQYFKKLYEAVYSLSQIENQKYIPKGYVDIIYDVEREVEAEINYLIEKRKNVDSLEDILPILHKIQDNLVCIISKIKD